jgi:predicted transcriptional regulator
MRQDKPPPATDDRKNSRVAAATKVKPVEKMIPVIRAALHRRGAASRQALFLAAIADCLQLSPAPLRGYDAGAAKRKIQKSKRQKQGARGRMSEETIRQVSRNDVLRMSVDIVAAYVSKNQIAAPQIPDVIRSVFGTLSAIPDQAAPNDAPTRAPAVPVRRSVMADYLVCLEDGRKLKTLKRHLKTAFNLTPEEYRNRWGLPADYPMVAPSYAKRRSDFAKKIGLGRKIP